MSVTVIEGNIIELLRLARYTANPEPMIAVHQLNATTDYALGLAKGLFETFPWCDVYDAESRATCSGNTFLGKSTASHGSGIVVVGLVAQEYKGEPGKYDPAHLGFDSAEQRLVWFKEALDHMRVRFPQQVTFHFPNEIGCGMGGGDWKLYKPVIETFAETNGVDIVLVDNKNLLKKK